MRKVLRRCLALAAATCAIVVFGGLGDAAQAQQKPVIKVSSLTLPVFNPLVWNIMKAPRPRREERLRARHPRLSVDLGFLCGLRHRRDRRADRRADDLPEALSGRRAAAHHRHRLHAGRPGDLHQGPGDQVAGRSQGQAARRRHGRLAISGRARSTPTPRASTSARTSPWSTPTSPSRAPNSRPAASTRRW